jgi:hypothetical protein
MDDSSSVKAGPFIGHKPKTITGHFSTDATLQDAIAQLALQGFDRADFSVPSEAQYVHTPEAVGAPGTEVDSRQLRTMISGLAMAAGALLGACIAIALGGTIWKLIMLTIALAAIGWGITNGVVTFLKNRDEQKREKLGRIGKLVLILTLRDPLKSSVARETMLNAGATEII